jgi:two-component system cell cycle response regulator
LPDGLATERRNQKVLKRTHIYWLIIILFTVLPAIIDINLPKEFARLSTFMWSLFLIPSVLLMVMYPKWKVIFGSVLFYSLLKYTAELFDGTSFNKIKVIVLLLDSLINGAILLTVGYFRLRYNKLLFQVQKLTLTDSLTGLYNRRYFDFYMEKVIPLSQKSRLVLLIMDIDYFKNINDHHGHQCGDEALKHISEIIRSNVRKSDGYVRFGGEEFAVILPNTDLKTGQTIAERICVAVDNSKFTYKNKQIHFTISVGVALYSGEKEEEFIEKADKALYRAKEHGRNKVVILGS